MKNGPYELIIPPTEYPGKRYRGKYAYEHTVVYWQHTGEVPPKGHEIHHINMNHRDNRIENLQLVTTQKHRLIHGKINTKRAKVIKHCGNCGNELIRKGSIIRIRLKRNVSGKVFCSISCGALYQFR